MGGFFTIDAKQAAAIAAEIRPGMVIPMHYRTASTGFNVIADIEEALAAFDGAANVRVLAYGEAAVVEA